MPWQNYLTTIFKLNDLGSQYDSLTTVQGSTYTDINLENGKEYCYKVKTIGTYGIGGILSPLVNFSQEICGTPLDTVPPCPPTLSVTNPCIDGDPNLPEDAFKIH